MYTNILIPTDGSELSSKAVSHGVCLAKALGAKVTFVTVRTPFHSMGGEPEMVVNMPDEYKTYVHDYFTAEAREALAAATAEAGHAGVPCEAVDIEHDHAFEGIIETAENAGCDVIVMASHGRRGVRAIVLGSETLKVLTHTKIPVLVHR